MRDSGHSSFAVLHLPGVVPVALMFSTAISILITPVAVWSVRTGVKNLLIYAPILWGALATYIFAVLVIWKNTAYGLYGVAFLGAVGAAVLGFIPADQRHAVARRMWSGASCAESLKRLVTARVEFTGGVRIATNWHFLLFLSGSRPHALWFAARSASQGSTIPRHIPRIHPVAAQTAALIAAVFFFRALTRAWLMNTNQKGPARSRQLAIRKRPTGHKWVGSDL